MEAIKLTVDTGAVPVMLVDNDDEVIGTFKFNPLDLDIVPRYDNVIKFFESKSLDENAGSDEVVAFGNEIKEQFNYLLNYAVADEAFKKCNPLTITNNGDLYCERLLEEIGGLIEKIGNQRLKKKKAKIQKATSKYHK